MRGAIKIPALIGVFLLLALIVIGVGESRRRAKLNDESQPDSQALSQTPNNPGGPAKPPRKPLSICYLPRFKG
jgi:hypothetical protein